ncbi:hypothetical protein [Oscillibacter sp.]|uniref:hypothetical protein n=1 Tax=Oscillibacter sp. TaxID=1945593 RepID=UPI0028ACC82B|nr:hypothetical protein [Oscillibacter sp.]
MCEFYLDEMRDRFVQSLDQELVHPVNRVIRLSYAPAFRTWIPLLRTQIAGKHQVFSLDNLLNTSDLPIAEKQQSLGTAIFQKLIMLGLELLPCVGVFISITDTLIGVALTSYHFQLRRNDLQVLKDNLGLRSHQRKKQHRLKQVVFVPNYDELSEREQNYLQFLCYLIQRGYLGTTALVIGCAENVSCPIQTGATKSFPLEEAALLMRFPSDVSVKNIVEILNIIGIQHLPEVQSVLSNTPNTDLLQSIIDKLLDQAFSDETISRDEFNHFLRICSFLFEPFLQEDIEKNYPTRNRSAVDLIECALKNRLLLRENAAPEYCFIEYFIREFYQENSECTFPTEVYQTLFSYLENKYPYQYADIALLSAQIGLPPHEIESRCIIAWYHEHETLPARKRRKLQAVLESGEIGRVYTELYDKYRTLNSNFDDRLTELYQGALVQVEESNLSAAAKCCYLNLISAIAFEAGEPIDFFERILALYFAAFQDLKIFSRVNPQYVEYVVDVLLLSTGMEFSGTYKNSLERLSGLIDPQTKMPTIKRLRLFRLGNAVFGTSKGHEFTKIAYQQSGNYPYEHVLSAINYSASLLCKAQFRDARSVLDATKNEDKICRINKNTEISFKNNWLVAQAMDGGMHKKDVRKEFETLFQGLEGKNFSDSVIVQNNYAAALIWSAPKTCAPTARQILKRIIQAQEDEYHNFFAIHNMLILCCLTADIDNFHRWYLSLRVPYLLRSYDDYFITKFKILSENFHDCGSLQQIETALLPLKERFSELDSNFYRNSVLWGVIERWFE